MILISAIWFVLPLALMNSYSRLMASAGLSLPIIVGRRPAGEVLCCYSRLMWRY